ncbi:M16 family metallopeptidase [Pajaroellobacter abortibovis]|nr:pitrilysin family protein [Pajaroellobacter abortibovis]
MVFLQGCSSSLGSSLLSSNTSLLTALNQDQKGSAQEKDDPIFQSPPPASQPRPFSFPSISRTVLPNGLQIDSVRIQRIPFVEIRLVVRAGYGYGSGAAQARLTALLLKEGGTRSMPGQQWMDKIESIGAEFSEVVGNDKTIFSLRLPSEYLADGFALLGEMIQSPRFDETEFKKIQARAKDIANEEMHSNSHFMATYAALQAFYPPQSPYRNLMLPSDVEATNLNGIKAFYCSFYSPSQAVLVVVGDCEGQAVVQQAQRSFGSWKANQKEKRKVAFASSPSVPRPARILLVDRLGSTQSEIVLALPAPERNSALWPVLKITAQALGGQNGRLFRDVRENKSLAYAAGAYLDVYAHGVQPLWISVGTQTPKTASAVAAILENLKSLRLTPVPLEEVRSASRWLNGSFLVGIGSIDSIANLITEQEILGLPDGYWDHYRQELEQVEPNQISTLAQSLFEPSTMVITVVGDAASIAESLCPFGEVVILDPSNSFKKRKTLPACAAQPAASSLEAPKL